MKQAVFLVHSQDRAGLLSQISGFFFERGLNILHCQQYSDELENQYFMRARIDIAGLNTTRKELSAAFEERMTGLGVKKFSVHYMDEIPKVCIMVSKTSHCLYDLLTRWQDGDLNCDIPLIVSNHPDLEYVADKFRIPYFCLPIVNGDKASQEKRLRELLTQHHIDLVVMARYMQVLSNDFCADYEQRVINIHHAFLPAFQGSNPYLRAWQRGVKMIGATAHYATADLDEGPIIEQDVVRCSHRDGPVDLARKGSDLEKVVLARAVRWHLEDRILVCGNKTVVFA